MKTLSKSVNIVLLPIVFAVAACAKTSGSTGPDKWDDASAAAQINASLKGRYFEIPFPYSRHSCTEYFAVGDTTILDVSELSTPPGATSATVMVKASTRVQANQSVNADSFAGLNPIRFR